MESEGVECGAALRGALGKFEQHARARGMEHNFLQRMVAKKPEREAGHIILRIVRERHMREFGAVQMPLLCDETILVAHNAKLRFEEGLEYEIRVLVKKSIRVRVLSDDEDTMPIGCVRLLKKFHVW